MDAPIPRRPTAIGPVLLFSPGAVRVLRRTRYRIILHIYIIIITYEQLTRARASSVLASFAYGPRYARCSCRSDRHQSYNPSAATAVHRPPSSHATHLSDPRCIGRDNLIIIIISSPERCWTSCP